MFRRLRSLRPGRRATAMALLAAMGFLSTGLAIGRSGFVTSPYRAERLTAITTALSNLEGDYVLAAGDSHILRWHTQEFCGLPMVNAGIDGATSADLASLLATLDLRHRPRAVIVTIGTNDAFRKRAADPAQAVAQFDAGFRKALTDLARHTPRIIVNAAPPLDGTRGTGFWAEAIGPIGMAAEAACRDNRACRFLSPFSPATPLATDGVHLIDYDAAYAPIETETCAALRGDPALTARAP